MHDASADDALSVEDALVAYTRGSAYASAGFASLMAANMMFKNGFSGKTSAPVKLQRVIP